MTDLIKINCPDCHAKYSIPEDKFPKKSKIKLNCKKCGTSFSFIVPEEKKDAQQESINTKNHLTEEIKGNATVITNPYIEKEDTTSDFLPKSFKITLTYKLNEKEIKKTLGKRLTIVGRIEGDIIINDPKISRKHLSIEIKSPTMVELRDLASSNGTFYNGMKINSIYLQSGDTIKIGSTSIHYMSQIQFT